MSLLIAVFLGLVLLHFTRFYQGRDFRWPVLLLWFLWIPVGLYILKSGLGLVYRLDRQPFRALDLGLSEDAAPPGGSFKLALKFETRRRGTIEYIVAELNCVRHRLVDGKRSVENLHHDRIVLGEDVVFEPGYRREFAIDLNVPDDSPYSYRSMEGKIVWSIRVCLSVVDWGELDEPIDVLVAPA